MQTYMLFESTSTLTEEGILWWCGVPTSQQAAAASDRRRQRRQRLNNGSARSAAQLGSHIKGQKPQALASVHTIPHNYHVGRVCWLSHFIRPAAGPADARDATNASTLDPWISGSFAFPLSRAR